MRKVLYRLSLAVVLICGAMAYPDCVECKDASQSECGTCNDPDCPPKPTPCQTILYSCELSPFQLPPSVKIIASAVPIQFYFPTAGAVLSISTQLTYCDEEFNDTSPPLYLRNNVLRI